MNLFSRSIKYLYITLFLIILLCSGRGFSADSCKVYIIKSRNLKPYDFVMEKVLDKVKSECGAFQKKIFEMNGDFNKADKIIQEIRKDPPHLILSIGSESTIYLAKNEGDIPVVFTMVYQYDRISEALEGKNNIKGVFVNLDMDEPFTVLKEIKPDLKRIGVLFMPDYSESQISYLEAAAQERGLHIVRVAIHSEPDIPQTLRNISDKIDILYLLSNPLFSKKEVIKRIIMGTLTNRIFVVGESFDIVKKGAMVGFGFDVSNIVSETAELMQEFRKTRNIQSLKSRKCRKFNLFLNARTAEKLEMKIPGSIKKSARKIIE